LNYLKLLRKSVAHARIVVEVLRCSCTDMGCGCSVVIFEHEAAAYLSVLKLPLAAVRSCKSSTPYHARGSRAAKTGSV